jgi:hypothetical protein
MESKWVFAEITACLLENGTVKRMIHFGLKKWYLDVADDRGNVYLGYWLQLKW